jgi:hypothetical protein
MGWLHRISLQTRARRVVSHFLALGICLACGSALAQVSTATEVEADVQFDVFFGFDDHIREGSWFPVAFELLNEGPSFTGTLLVGPESGLTTQPRTYTVELPTGTRKRVILPVFPSAGRLARWDAHLLNEAGQVVADRGGILPIETPSALPLLGALPRTYAGMPVFPEIPERIMELQPTVARLQPDYLPDNPIALEALTTWYLNSERAIELKPPQADALLMWLHAGGHLVVALEQPGDVDGMPWLRSILPFAPAGLAQLPAAPTIEQWVANGPRPLPVPVSGLSPATGSRRTPRSSLMPRSDNAIVPNDPFTRLPHSFDAATPEVQVVTGLVLSAQRLLSLGDHPLIVSAPRGRGRVTVLTFSPERDPLRAWDQRGWFWARLTSLPQELLSITGHSTPSSGPSVDSLFGAMLDSRQVRKLPVTTLLLLLVVYLAIIGPLDQWILRRLGRPMWTWVTFPTYVIAFSALMYFIGYRLRSGELEWNEIQVVDQLPRTESTAAWRGRTWASLYSPGNARYRLIADRPHATLRAEYHAGSANPNPNTTSLRIHHVERGYDAEAFVPVWVNQLFVADWLEAGPILLSGELTVNTGFRTIQLENPSDLNFSDLRLAWEGRLYDLGALAPGARLQRNLIPAEARDLDDFLTGLARAAKVVRQRRHAFGREGAGQLDRNLDPVIQGSFADRAGSGPGVDSDEGFSTPAGFDLSPLLARDEAVLFAWSTGQTLAPPIHRFSPRRQQRDTILRTVLPVRQIDTPAP